MSQKFCSITVQEGCEIVHQCFLSYDSNDLAGARYWATAEVMPCQTIEGNYPGGSHSKLEDVYIYSPEGENRAVIVIMSWEYALIDDSDMDGESTYGGIINYDEVKNQFTAPWANQVSDCMADWTCENVYENSDEHKDVYPDADDLIPGACTTERVPGMEHPADA